MKYRVMPSPLLVAQFEAWGASAVPIDYAECYNALQQGVIDGVEWPITSIRDWKLWEVQKSITLTHHGYLAYLVIGNKRWFESLPSDLQDIILSAELEAAKKQRQLTTERESLSLTDIQKHMEVIHLTDEQKKGFQNASMNAWPVWKEKVGSDFFQKVENAVTRVATQ
jgi:C4-dicarboxylate-binding protein DctP